MKNTVATYLSLLTAFLILLPSVKAHGYITTFTANGKSYNGITPGSASGSSPIREISTIFPVKGASNPNLSCGQNAKPASLVADVDSGSTVSFKWGDQGGRWPHNTGPLMTYMASCGSTTCDKFDSSKAKWFKIAEAGRKANGDWVQQDIMNGQTYSTKVPANLVPGQYLIRHEIIALHLAITEGGAEFYPSCIQVNVKGSGTDTPPAKSLVSFPGAYKDTDPGIFDPSVYNPGAKYTFPGPNLVSLVTGSGSGSDPVSSSYAPSPSNVMSSSGPNAVSPSASPSPTSTGRCKSRSDGKTRSIVKRDTVVRNASEESRPKHRSRIMARLRLSSQS